MAKFVIIFVCLAVIQASVALKCMKNDDQDMTKFVEETCRDPGTSQQAGCLTEVYKEGKDKKEVTVKNCVYYSKDQKYGCAKKPDSEEVSCNVCGDDLCNKSGASVAGLNVIAVIGVVALFLVPKFFA